MELSPGELFLYDKYRIEALVGRGASGCVYRARHLGTSTPRAIRVLGRDEVGVESAQFSSYRLRFALEAQLGGSVQHPHLLRVHEFEQEADRLVLVMEYAPGGSLEHRLAQERETGRPFPIDEAVRVALDVARGLAAIHAQDVVHRDLKPSSILFDESRRAMLADLGLAQVPGGLSERSHDEQAFCHPGTQGYMSPEQETTTDNLAAASDVYALGLVLFEMLTGRNYSNLSRATRARLLRPEVPESLDPLVARLLEVSPDKRPGDGAEAELLLDQQAAALSVDDEPAVDEDLAASHSADPAEPEPPIAEVATRDWPDPSFPSTEQIWAAGDTSPAEVSPHEGLEVSLTACPQCGQFNRSEQDACIRCGGGLVVGDPRADLTRRLEKTRDRRWLLLGAAILALYIGGLLTSSPERAAEERPAVEKRPTRSARRVQLEAVPDGALPSDAVLDDGTVTAPVEIYRVEPQYTELAKAVRKEGLVVVQAVIDSRGYVREAKVLKGLGFGLDESSVEAVKQWKFRPGTLDGEPVDVVFTLSVRFQITTEAPEIPMR